MGSGPTLVVLAGGRARRYGGCKPLAPVGPGGEPVIDLVCSDARDAGFGTIVLVVGPATGATIRYHVERCWPRGVDVHFALQEAPLGTVHAVLSAADHLQGIPFGVANADDLYGQPALALLAQHLQGAGEAPAPNALVSFQLRDAIVGDSPVTRGICQVDAGGMLHGLDERRQVMAIGGDQFVSGDGRSPKELPGDAPVSMNLWGFGTDMLGHLREAMERATDASEDAEVLLPEVVGSLVAPGPGGAPAAARFAVLRATGRCIGVTHPDDLELVRAELAQWVGAGERPANVWASAPAGATS